MGSSANSPAAFPTTAAWAPAPEDLVPRLEDLTFRGHFERALEEAVKDPLDREVMRRRYGLVTGQTSTMQQLGEHFGVSGSRIGQRLYRAWGRIRAKAAAQERKNTPGSCHWLLAHLA
jgi:DNA-directed RNA polymerase sigma subunit (sigma70/sigma32)